MSGHPFAILMAVFALAIPITGVCAEEPDLKPFAQASEGKARFVIALPHKERGEEENFRVELIDGKPIKTDGVNRYRMSSSIEEKNRFIWELRGFAGILRKGEILCRIQNFISRSLDLNHPERFRASTWTWYVAKWPSEFPTPEERVSAALNATKSWLAMTTRLRAVGGT